MTRRLLAVPATPVVAGTAATPTPHPPEAPMSLGLLTSDQVAQLAGIDRSRVRDWTRARGIRRHRWRGDRRYYYPAAAVRAAVRQPAQTAQAAAPWLRLARFTANPLNH